MILGVFLSERTKENTPMALSQFDVSELLAALRAGDGLDLIRDLVRLVLQELVESEAAEAIGAGRYERRGERVTERNGHRSKTLSTKGGDVEIAIPKLRKGSYFPSFLEPRRRIDQALYAVVMEAYVKGVSTRSVDDLVAALGVNSGISRSEVSRTHLPAAGRGGGGLPHPVPFPRPVPLHLPGRYVYACAMRPPRGVQGDRPRHGRPRGRTP